MLLSSPGPRDTAVATLAGIGRRIKQGGIIKLWVQTDTARLGSYFKVSKGYTSDPPQEYAASDHAQKTRLLADIFNMTAGYVPSYSYACVFVPGRIRKYSVSMESVLQSIDYQSFPMAHA